VQHDTRVSIHGWPQQASIARAASERWCGGGFVSVRVVAAVGGVVGVRVLVVAMVVMRVVVAVVAALLCGCRGAGGR
jgi:hypothetical protein